MDVLTFIARMSWPVVIVVIMILAPWTVKQVSGHLRSVKKDRDGFSIEFNSKIDDND
jgi:hypothetical protein